VETSETKKKITDTNLEEFKHKMGTIDVDGLIVSVTVTDARFRYGHIDLKVTPISGRGERWVERTKVTLL
jgi:hypothetical protein